ncbi:maleylpyruvate isomerase N-terminal domain-containing protein [Streptomyces altiplanensis]
MARPGVSVEDIPRTSPARARTVNEAEIRASLETMSSLDTEAWSRPTACTGWTVRDMVAHEVGQFEELPKPWLMITRIRRAGVHTLSRAHSTATTRARSRIAEKCRESG